MLKGKKYDWKDSNMALFGSPLEREVKKAAAGKEPAWIGSGQEVGLEIWRVVKFNMEAWPKEQYGEFYMGDSYIVLNTWKEEDEEEYQYDLHFWIGKYSTQDEYGTAAYKTVELDTYHDDKPIQHREVQGFESDLFRSYFGTIEYLAGGADSGFRHVTPDTYEPRLLHISGSRKNVEVQEVLLSKNSIKPGDIYILDLGTELIQWNGSGANMHEKSKAMQYLMDLKNKRSHENMTSSVFDEGDDQEFWERLPDEEVEEEDEETLVEGTKELFKELFRLSDAEAAMNFDKVMEGDALCKDDLKTEDVFVVDNHRHVYVWVGNGASEMEKFQAIGRAHIYLSRTDHGIAPITRILEGKETPLFKANFAEF